jgi:hypothetical protein
MGHSVYSSLLISRIAEEGLPDTEQMLGMAHESLNTVLHPHNESILIPAL